MGKPALYLEHERIAGAGYFLIGREPGLPQTSAPGFVHHLQVLFLSQYTTAWVPHVSDSLGKFVENFAFSPEYYIL